MLTPHGLAGRPSGACAAVAALALAACGGGGTDTALPDVQASATESAAQSHDASAQFGLFHIQRFTIRTLGNRADLISNGDALVEVQVPEKVPLDKVKITLNGKNISAAFSVADASKRTLRGLVTGLRVGNSLLRVDATTRGGDLWGFLHGYDDDANLVITNHPRGGPILLGSQSQPWICATPQAVPANGDIPASNASGLTTTAVDAACNIDTEYKLFYRTTATTCSTAVPDPSPPATPSATNCFKPYIPGVTPPDLATITFNGTTMPYIVRVERGTLNRGIYDIAVLFDPTKPWTALAPQAQWNGKIVHSFGASTGHTRLQNRSTQNWSDQQALSRGFMVIDHSLTDSINNSNRVLVAETVMMMKEHITDNYGEIKYLMGNGCSGGSIQQNTVSSIFPGLLDGIQPACTYPDSITTGQEVGDCVLLVNLYDSDEWKALMAGKTQTEINAKKTAINGHLDHVGCQSWNNAFGFANIPGNYVRKLVLDQPTGAMGVIPGELPRNNCNLPASMVYDPVSNPTGVRCSDPDNAAAVWGTTHNELAPTGKRALQTADNVGIQYGLGALTSGAITAEEFIVLNERIGGTDNDSTRRLERTTADLPAVRTAYRAGVVSSGANLGKVPIIDSRGYDESGIHYIWRTYSERARIGEANDGNHGNQVIWRYGTGLLPATAAQVNAVTVASFLTMDTWLSNLLVSAPKDWINDVRTQAQVIAGKPAGLLDLCYLTGDTSFMTPVTDMALCDADPRLMKHDSPRQVAGGPLAENILKCSLKPINTAAYLPVVFTAEQLNRLYATFPDGVCNWSKPGIGQQPARSPLTFANGPGGKPLPHPPGTGGAH